jgi:hypothetical protein
MGRQTGSERRAAWEKKAYDPSNWENWSQSKLRQVYGSDKFRENQDALNDRRNLQGSNFLKSFLGTLASPVTNAMGMMGVPGAIGAGYGNPQSAAKTYPQPWIIDSNTGSVIANPALNDAQAYVNSYNASQNAYNSTSPYQIANSGLNVSTQPTNKGNFFTNLFGIGKNNALGETDWLAATSNSPAAQAGFTPEQRWALQQQTRDFRGAQKAGTMDEFVKKYPQSQTAKERAIGNRIPTSMDMEF